MILKRKFSLLSNDRIYTIKVMFARLQSNKEENDIVESKQQSISDDENSDEEWVFVEGSHNDDFGYFTYKNL